MKKRTWMILLCFCFALLCSCGGEKQPSSDFENGTVTQYIDEIAYKVPSSWIERDLKDNVKTYFSNNGTGLDVTIEKRYEDIADVVDKFSREAGVNNVRRVEYQTKSDGNIASFSYSREGKEYERYVFMKSSLRGHVIFSFFSPLNAKYDYSDDSNKVIESVSVEEPKYKIVKTEEGKRASGDSDIDYFVVVDSAKNKEELELIFLHATKLEKSKKYHTVFFYDDEEVAINDLEQKQYISLIDDQYGRSDLHYYERPNSGNFLLDQEVKTEAIRSSDGAMIGMYAYIDIHKDTMKKADMQDFMAFVENNIAGKNYNWFAIMFEDGTGITFPNCSPEIAVYGEVDSEGAVISGLGNIRKQTDGTYMYEKY